MHSGSIPVGDLPGGLDLQATLESGQTYLWWREDGDGYTQAAPAGGQAWYRTTVRSAGGQPGVVRARQRGGHLEWEASVDAAPALRRRLRLADDLPAIRAAAPDAEVIRRAFDAYSGMRLVDAPVIATLVTFICSAQMRVERIHGMQAALRNAFGESLSFKGTTARTYPTPAAIAASSEARLRDLGLGYRAPYVLATAQRVAAGDGDPAQARDQPYEAARAHLRQFDGVGNKVADCVLLFALDFLEAVPLDTWIRRAIATYFPACDRGSYAETSAAIRERLGGETAGYTQTYLFHYLRHAENPPVA